MASEDRSLRRKTTQVDRVFIIGYFQFKIGHA